MSILTKIEINGIEYDLANCIFVRYSANADGTDFTEKRQEGQGYIGIAVDTTAPTEKKDYQWLPLSSDAKVDKIATTGGNRVYAVDPNGKQIVLDAYIGLSNAQSLVLRSGNGNAQIATPTEDMHIANKKYVDTAINALLTRLEFLETNAELKPISVEIENLTSQENLYVVYYDENGNYQTAYLKDFDNYLGVIVQPQTYLYIYDLNCLADFQPVSGDFVKEIEGETSLQFFINKSGKITLDRTTVEVTFVNNTAEDVLSIWYSDAHGDEAYCNPYAHDTVTFSALLGSTILITDFDNTAKQYKFSGPFWTNSVEDNEVTFTVREPATITMNEKT